MITAPIGSQLLFAIRVALGRTVRAFALTCSGGNQRCFPRKFRIWRRQCEIKRSRIDQSHRSCARSSSFIIPFLQAPRVQMFRFANLSAGMIRAIIAVDSALQSERIDPKDDSQPKFSCSVIRKNGGFFCANQTANLQR